MKNKKIMLLVIFLMIMVVAIGCTNEPIEEELDLNPDENGVVEENIMPNNDNTTEMEIEEETPPMDTNTDNNE